MAFLTGLGFGLSTLDQELENAARRPVTAPGTDGDGEVEKYYVEWQEAEPDPQTHEELAQEAVPEPETFKQVLDRLWDLEQRMEAVEDEVL